MIVILRYKGFQFTLNIEQNDHRNLYILYIIIATIIYWTNVINAISKILIQILITITTKYDTRELDDCDDDDDFNDPW